MSLLTPAVPAYAEPSAHLVGDVTVVTTHPSDPVNFLVSVTVDPAPSTYTVQAGDTLSAIGQEFGVSWSDLAAINGLSDPDLILPGQVLKLTGPVPANPAPVVTHAPAVVHIAAVSPAPAAAPAPAGGTPAVWACIGAHESGNNPAENTGNGFFGMYQFTASTWLNVMKALGITSYRTYPYAAAAPAGVQLQAAEYLQSVAGWGQWPNTSRMCGV